MDKQAIIQALLMIPVMLISLTVHEYAHARIAYARGDATARNLGRLSLNPLKHLDLIGAICMIFFRFGWAKPVPVNSRNLRRPQSDMALISIAGPISNFLLAFLGMFLYLSTIKLGNTLVLKNIIEPDTFASNALKMLVTFFALFHIANISLAVFNLIPIPPLDGSRILTMLLPPKYYWKLMEYERYFGLILLALVYLGVLSGALHYVTSQISSLIEYLCKLIPIFEEFQPFIYSFF